MTSGVDERDSARGIGWYGKLPARGDFIGRGLSAAWRREWDDWLRQGFVLAAERLGGGEPLRERLGEFVPWRYAATSSVGERWCGIVVPSHDRVGRVFPLTLAERVDTGASPARHAQRLVSLLDAARRGPDELDAAIWAALAESLSNDDPAAGQDDRSRDAPVGSDDAPGDETPADRTRATGGPAAREDRRDHLGTPATTVGGPDDGDGPAATAIELADPPLGRSWWWPIDAHAAASPMVSTWPPEPALLGELLCAVAGDGTP